MFPIIATNPGMIKDIIWQVLLSILFFNLRINFNKLNNNCWLHFYFKYASMDIINANAEIKIGTHQYLICVLIDF